MTTRPLKVLLVEDSPADARLIRESLVDAGVHDLEIQHVQLLAEALEELEKHHYDVVLLDLLLPDNMGPDTVAKVAAVDPEVPVVVLTGVSDEQLARETVGYGAEGFLVKQKIDGRQISGTVRRAIERRKRQSATAHAARPAPARPTWSTRPQTTPSHDDKELRAFTSAVADALDREARAIADAAHRLAPSATADPGLAEDARVIGASAARARELVRAVCDYLDLLGYEPRPTDCRAGDSFDEALVRLQARIVQRRLHVTRYPMPRVRADPGLLARLFEAALTAALALSDDQDLGAHLDARPSAGKWFFSLTTRRSEPSRNPDEPSPEPEPPDDVNAVDDARVPELALAKRIAARVGGDLWAVESPDGNLHAVLFTVPGAASRDRA